MQEPKNPDAQHSADRQPTKKQKQDGQTAEGQELAAVPDFILWKIVGFLPDQINRDGQTLRDIARAEGSPELQNLLDVLM